MTALPILTAKKVDFDSNVYSRSRKAYTLECAFEYFVAILLSGEFLAVLFSRMGFTDSQVGIISSLISLAFLFSLASVFVIDKITNIKKTAIIFHISSQMFFMAIYLLPLLPLTESARKLLSVLCIVIGYFGNYFVTSMIYKWGNSFVEPTKRARFSANKEIISLISGMAVSIIIGAVMDMFYAADDFASICIFVAVSILIFSICNFICFLLMKNEKKTAVSQKEKIKFKSVLTDTFGVKGFRAVLFADCIWKCAVYTTIGFLGTYKTGELAYTLTLVQIINVAGCLARATLSRSFGRYSDKYSFAKGFSLAIAIAAVAFLCCSFTMPSTGYLIIAFSILYNVCQAGTAANLNNAVYSYVDSEYFVQASAFKNSISGVFGFLASLIASRLLSAIQNNGNTVLGMKIYGQQLLAFISFLICILLFVYSKFYLEKQTIIKQ